MKLEINKFNTVAILSITFFSIIFIANYCKAAAEETSISAINLLKAEDSYKYETEGRSDPFKPFVSTQSVAPTDLDPNEIMENDEELYGMRLFEPGQLNLVGIMISSANEMALVEDQAKKGYIIQVGTAIGKRGIVTKIDPHQVTITETAKTRSGKEIKTSITMRLNKEGD